MLRYAPSPYRLTYERPALNSGSDWEPYCCSVRARMPVLISRCARQFESARDYHQRPRPSSFAWLSNRSFPLLPNLATDEERVALATVFTSRSTSSTDLERSRVRSKRGKMTIYRLQSVVGCKKSWHAGKSSRDSTGIIPNGESSV
jgi:hypothetical protein